MLGGMRTVLSHQARRLESTRLVRRFISWDVLVLLSLYLGWYVGRYGNSFAKAPGWSIVAFFVVLVLCVVVGRGVAGRWERGRG